MATTKESQDLSPFVNEFTSYSTHHSENVHFQLPTFSEVEKKLSEVVDQ
jgi:hypothetical protein